jgi:formylglycine-generating enzyme required for sulfatase activity
MEAEWEYAARGGTESAFSNGGNLAADDVNDCVGPVVLDNGKLLGSVAVFCVTESGGPEDVGAKAANPFGLFDMHGNVWEFCYDDWDGADEGPGAVVDPRGDPGYPDGVIRGGAWYNRPWYLRSANRERAHYLTKGGGLGFRLVRTEAP